MINADNLNTALIAEMKTAVEAEVEKLFLTDNELMTQLRVHAINKIVSKIIVEQNIDTIIGDKLAEQFANEFNSKGLYSEAQQKELTLLDDEVIVENTIKAQNSTVAEQSVTKNLTVTGDLVVLGNVDSTHPTAWAAVLSDMKREVTEDVVNNTKEEMVTSVLSQCDSIDFTQITMAGKVVLSENQIGLQITESNLMSVGRLRDLTVTGPTALDDTLHVSNNRVGINTSEPSCALNIWDDEVEIVAGKLKSQTAFIGTARAQTLELGVNNIGHLSIDNTGTVRVEKFQIGERRLAFEGKLPGYAGKPGDMVFNTLFDTQDPVFAWICKGDFSWTPLRAAL